MDSAGIGHHSVSVGMELLGAGAAIKSIGPESDLAVLVFMDRDDIILKKLYFTS
jgi:hypothetical protein